MTLKLVSKPPRTIQDTKDEVSVQLQRNHLEVMLNIRRKDYLNNNITFMEVLSHYLLI